MKKTSIQKEKRYNESKINSLVEEIFTNYSSLIKQPNLRFQVSFHAFAKSDEES